MEDQAKFIVDEVRKALEENSQMIITELISVFGSKKNQVATGEDEGGLPEAFHGYEIQDVLGEGTFGTVYLVQNSESEELYAMKVIKMTDDEMTKSLARELSMMYTVQHENIVRMKHVFYQSNSVCMVMEYAMQDLNSYIQMKKRPNKPKEWLKQILAAVAYLHNRNIIHRDLKPENILIAGDGSLKLADFGSAREWFVDDVDLTPKVTTIAYRAPELLLGSEVYTSMVDMWSIGCIFAELEELTPLFQVDDYETLSELTTIEIIFKKLGTPTEESWPGVSSLPNYPQQIPHHPQVIEIVPTLGPVGNDLLAKLLCCNPRHRITAKAALEHPYLCDV